MADFLFNTGSKELWDGTIGLLTATIKAMLCTSTYVPNRDDDVADAGGASDPVDAELSGTGYVAGWGGSGRKTLASKTITVDKVNDRSEFDCADLLWTGINAGIAAKLVIIKEGAANDTTTRLLSVHETNFPVTTNGGDLTVAIAGLLRLSTV